MNSPALPPTKRDVQQHNMLSQHLLELNPINCNNYESHQSAKKAIK